MKLNKVKLNKKICQKCLMEYNDSPWYGWYEYEWETKFVVVCERLVCCYPINETPKYCPYKLEHLVMNEIK